MLRVSHFVHVNTIMMRGWMAASGVAPGSSRRSCPAVTSPSALLLLLALPPLLQKPRLQLLPIVQVLLAKVGKEAVDD